MIQKHHSRRSLRHKYTVSTLGVAALVAAGFFISTRSSISSVYNREVLTPGSEVTVGEVLSPKYEAPVHIPAPEAVRAIYMSSWVAGTPSIRNDIVHFVTNGSEINSIMIDIKDATGKIAFEVSDEELNRLGWTERRIPDIRAFIRELHGHNIYVIGRIAVFQDPHITKKMPEIAVADIGGGVWKDRKGLAFVDVGAKSYWDLIVRIARESEQVGFDEINFDYIRYPSDGALSRAVYNHSKDREKSAVLEEFFKYLRAELKDLPVPISADIFGLATWSEDDLGIGQILEKAAPHFDYIAPMVYPSHYDAGFQDFKNPSLHPYEVIFASMQRAKFRLEKMGQDPHKLRAWIQDFDLNGVEYGVAEVNAQKKAIYDTGLKSWMSWDPSNKYTRPAYRPATSQ